MLALLFLAAAASAPQQVPLAEVSEAMAAGRLDQAKSMIARAIAAGANGPDIDRLLADHAFASRKNGEALARYKALIERQPDDAQLLERAAISAVRLRATSEARALADRATSLPAASWIAWNTRGVVADLLGDFETADASYARALELAPDRPEVLNNAGWSLLLQGNWEDAITLLERAAVRMPKSVRALNNLELARAAVASDLPQRRRGETENSWASRLNDAGVAAQLRGDRARAIAAFSRALEARGSWYARAANNLAAVDRAE